MSFAKRGNEVVPCSRRIPILRKDELSSRPLYQVERPFRCKWTFPKLVSTLQNENEYVFLSTSTRGSQVWQVSWHIGWEKETCAHYIVSKHVHVMQWKNAWMFYNSCYKHPKWAHACLFHPQHDLNNIGDQKEGKHDVDWPQIGDSNTNFVCKR